MSNIERLALNGHNPTVVHTTLWELAIDTQLPARLSFDRMNPGLRARWARLESSGVFAVVPEPAGERRRSVTSGMAMDSGATAATASVDRVWLGICKRIAAR